jgi:hypothetical protein
MSTVDITNNFLPHQVKEKAIVSVDVKNLHYGTIIELKETAVPLIIYKDNTCVPKKYIKGLWAVDEVTDDGLSVNINRVLTPYPGAYCSYISVDDILCIR